MHFVEKDQTLLMGQQVRLKSLQYFISGQYVGQNCTSKKEQAISATQDFQHQRLDNAPEADLQSTPTPPAAPCLHTVGMSLLLGSRNMSFGPVRSGH